MPLISVIVPVYKVEKYLSACVDSILSQFFSDFELILVDDGSPDACGEICEQYAKKDSRIRVIHQENGGLSAARNTGMDVAQGEYITFVDSDDVIAPYYLGSMIDIAVRTRAEIVVGKFVQFTDAADVTKLWEKTSLAPEYIKEVPHKACLWLYNDSSKLPINACGKLFQRNSLGELRFPAGRIHEDQFFVPLAVYRMSLIAVMDKRIYGYRYNEAGITHSCFSNKRYDDIWAIDKCISFFKSKGEGQLVSAAKKKREIILAKYSILARNAKVVPPKEYRLSLLKAIRCLKRYASVDSFEYYMGLVHPKLPVICQYARKIRRTVLGR